MDRAPITLPSRVAAHGAGALKPHLLAQPAPPSRSDYDFDPASRPAEARKLMPAAVLMPIVRRAEPTVLFTRRTAHLARHAGQVSFPGGRVSEADPNAIATALRETEEETGIAADFVDIAGFLETYETGTGFAIVPVVGVLEEGFTLVPDPGEVDEIFEVPLGFLLNGQNRETKTAEWQGRTRRFYAYTYRGHYIWGATAAMLSGFAERLGEAL